MKNSFQIIFTALLLGIVDQIHEDIALVEYESKGKMHHIHLIIDKETCNPKEGQEVMFQNGKIINCIDK
tara:strand:+ start:670 stop:876 length:207 start_codon:yes stop_codon:yes gene_type:complete